MAFADQSSFDRAEMPPRIEQTYWGYILPAKDGGEILNPISRWVVIFFGVSFVFAAVGMWVVPGASFDGSVLPIKLAMSSFFLLLGLFMLQLGQEKGKPEVQVDLHRREIRLVSRQRDGFTKLEKVFSFEEIEDVVVEGQSFKVMGHDLTKIGEIALAEERKGR